VGPTFLALGIPTVPPTAVLTIDNNLDVPLKLTLVKAGEIPPTRTKEAEYT
jgi:hypothetical protein